MSSLLLGMDLRPAIQLMAENIDEIDLIFLGTPYKNRELQKSTQFGEGT